jgi:uncharacterized protein (DUF2249 family)
VPKFKVMDVRPLLARGLEPFAQIRRTIDALKPGEGLSVAAPFLPSPLIELLQAEGFQARVERLPGSGWVTHFWRDDSGPAR